MKDSSWREDIMIGVSQGLGSGAIVMFLALIPFDTISFMNLLLALIPLIVPVLGGVTGARLVRTLQVISAGAIGAGVVGTLFLLFSWIALSLQTNLWESGICLPAGLILCLFTGALYSRLAHFLGANQRVSAAVGASIGSVWPALLVIFLMAIMSTAD